MVKIAVKHKTEMVLIKCTAKRKCSIIVSYYYC